MDEILHNQGSIEILADFNRVFVIRWTNQILDDIREEILTGKFSHKPSREDFMNIILERLRRYIADLDKKGVRKVINATGVIIHTNLGRSPISLPVLHRMQEVLSGYTNLEYDSVQGGRGHRDTELAHILRTLLDCEDATAVNNNAGAVFLILNSLARGEEVIVSRGELVEIGGSFRIPDIMAQSGAVLREVGTTNKTRISDYEAAINENTRMILHVHRSNFEMIGFTASPSISELVRVAHESNLHLIVDAGSGYLFDFQDIPVRQEPVVSDLLTAGADLVCFSGDKLLGGPQAGLIVGGSPLVNCIRKNPLMRVLRLDKFILYTLAETLKSFFKNNLVDQIPIFTMMQPDAASMRKRSRNFRVRLINAVPELINRINIQEGASVMGGGSTPGQMLPGYIISISSSRGSIAQLERFLRAGSPAIVARVEADQLILDLRTVLKNDELFIIDRLKKAHETELL